MARRGASSRSFVDVVSESTWGIDRVRAILFVGVANDCDRVPKDDDDAFEGELSIELSVLERPSIRDVFPGLLEGESNFEGLGLEEKTVSKRLDRFCGSFEGDAKQQSWINGVLQNARMRQRTCH